MGLGELEPLMIVLLHLYAQYSNIPAFHIV